MLEVGNGGMTEAEYRSHFSIWALAKVLRFPHMHLIMLLQFSNYLHFFTVSWFELCRLLS
jgi:hypothetical protein